MQKAPYVFNVETFSVMVFYLSKPAQHRPQLTLFIIVQDQSSNLLFGSFSQNKDIKTYVRTIFKDLLALFLYIRKNCNNENILMTKKGHMVVNYTIKDISQRIKIQNHKIQHLEQGFDGLWQSVKGLWDSRYQSSTQDIDSLLDIVKDIKNSRIILYDKIDPRIKASEEQASDFRKMQVASQPKPLKSDLRKERKRVKEEQNEQQTAEQMAEHRLNKLREEITVKKRQPMIPQSYRPIMYHYALQSDKKGQSHRQQLKKAPQFVQQFEQSEGNSASEEKEIQKEEVNLRQISLQVKQVISKCEQVKEEVQRQQEQERRQRKALLEQLEQYHKQVMKELSQFQVKQEDDTYTTTEVATGRGAKKSSKKPQLKRLAQVKEQSAQSGEREVEDSPSQDSCVSFESIEGRQEYPKEDSFGDDDEEEGQEEHEAND